MIHPIELVMYGVIFKCPLEKCDLPDNLKWVFQVSIYVFSESEMSFKKQFPDEILGLQSKNIKYKNSIPSKSHKVVKSDIEL